MSWNPNQGQSPDPQSQGGYGGYSGYTPPTQPQQPDPDPYGSQQYGAYQAGTQGGYQPPQSTYTGGQQQQQQQYQSTYQPPRSALKTPVRSGATDPTTLRMDAKNEAVLSYFLWFLSGFVFFIIERKNRFVQFCAAQSFILFGGATVLLGIFKVIGLIPLLGALLSPLLGCATLVIAVPTVLLWLFLMVQAYRGVQVKLPIVGNYAEALVQKFTRKPRTV